MTQPRGRRDNARGRNRGQGGSSQRRSRQPAQRGARGGQAGYGERGGQAGYGGRGGPGGGSNNGPIIAVIAVAGVAIVVILILLITSGNDKPEYQVPPVAQKPAPKQQPPSNIPQNLPPKPLTPAEKTQVTELVDRLDRNYSTAKELKDEGFRAHDVGDREFAQRCFREAREMLQEMIGTADLLFEELGDERVERYCYTHYEIQGKWQRLLADFLKHVE